MNVYNVTDYCRSVERRAGGLMWGVQGCGMSVKCMYVHVGNTIESELADTGGSTATPHCGNQIVAQQPSFGIQGLFWGLEFPFMVLVLHSRPWNSHSWC